MAVAEREIIHVAAPADVAAEGLRPASWRCTRDQFHQMGDLSLFEGERTLLVEGEILVMPPVNPPHQGITTIAGDVLRAAFGGGFVVREQGPYNIGAATDPLPDIAVVAGNLRDFLVAHPARAVLIVEVSDSTLAYDRREKMSLYASAGIAEYWIININGAQIEVHRQPILDEAQPHGFGYQDRTVHQGGDIIQPLASSRPVAVSALLP